MNSSQLNFAVYYAGDGYSTAQKIMGRQSAGKSLLRGVAHFSPMAAVRGVGLSESGGVALREQLAESGFTGDVRWSTLPNTAAAKECGTLYFPGPPIQDLAAARNRLDPQAFSLMGLTHTVASKGAIESIAALVLPPFKPWDALICTSSAALGFVRLLHEDMRAYWREHTGAHRFNQVVTPLIPLGIHTADFRASPTDDDASRVNARAALDLKGEDVAFLFAGRLTFHAKANPAAAYRALQAVATAGKPVVCIEAGVFANEAVRQSFEAAQKALAPDVRFIWVDGAEEAAYRQAWQAADVFLSLSDNIQETFGLTPVEAMAAGLPVVVSDWNGYKDTVRHGVDGLRIPTYTPPPGAGVDLAVAHGLEVDNYDFHIGRTSLATVVEPRALHEALSALVNDGNLRKRLGQAGALRARECFDWQVVLPQYVDLAQELEAIRLHATAKAGAEVWPQREDPFKRFAHFPTQTLQGHWKVSLEADALQRLNSLRGLNLSRYGLHDALLPAAHLNTLTEALKGSNPTTVAALLSHCGLQTPAGVLALMWLWKFAVIRVETA